jgi:hypothetical protein
VALLKEIGGYQIPQSGSTGHQGQQQQQQQQQQQHQLQVPEQSRTNPILYINSALCYYVVQSVNLEQPGNIGLAGSQIYLPVNIKT